MTLARYWHATCDGMRIDIKTEGDEDQHRDFDDSLVIPCPFGTKNRMLGDHSHEMKEVTEWQHGRFTAEQQGCRHCGQDITFLPDLDAWVHDEEDVSILSLKYGRYECQDGSGKLAAPA